MADKTMRERMASLIGSFSKAAKLDEASFKALEKSLEEFVDPVDDLWTGNEQHRNPTRGEIVTGPVEAASGAGGANMVNQYSNPAPQHGNAELYAQFSRMLAPLSADMAAVKANAKILTTMVLAMNKAEKDESEDEDDFVEKANQLITKARRLVIKAEMADEDDEEEDVAESIDKAARAVKSAKAWLMKASEESEGEEDEKVEKAMDALRNMRKRVTKAETALRDKIQKAAAIKAKEEEEEKEKREKEEAAKAAAAAAAAAVKGDDKGNQAASQDPATGNQDDAAAKAAKEAAAKAAAKASTDNRLDIMSKNLSDVMNLLMTGNRQSGLAVPPDLAKAVQASESIETALEEGQDNGTYSREEVVAGKSILSGLDAVRKGRIDKSIVSAQIVKAPAAIRQLFSNAA